MACPGFWRPRITTHFSLRTSSARRTRTRRPGVRSTHLRARPLHGAEDWPPEALGQRLVVRRAQELAAREADVVHQHAREIRRAHLDGFKSSLDRLGSPPPVLVRLPLLRLEDEAAAGLEGVMDPACVDIKFYGAFSSTPSTRRLLDSVVGRAIAEK